MLKNSNNKFFHFFSFKPKQKDCRLYDQKVLLPIIGDFHCISIPF